MRSNTLTRVSNNPGAVHNLQRIAVAFRFFASPHLCNLWIQVLRWPSPMSGRTAPRGPASSGWMEAQPAGQDLQGFGDGGGRPAVAHCGFKMGDLGEPWSSVDEFWGEGPRTM